MTPVLDRGTLELNLSFLLGRNVLFGNPEIRNLDKDGLKRAYYRRAHDFHPDKATSRGLDPEYLATRFRALQEVYQTLLDSWQSGRMRYFLNDQGLGAEKPIPQDGEKTRIFHAGAVPDLRLRFAQFLYYSKKIDWDSLIASLTWQFRSRPKLGEIGAEFGFLDYQEIGDILRNKGMRELFGQAALRLGYLDNYRLSVLMGKQRMINLPIGRYFIDKGLLLPWELTTNLNALRLHNIGVDARALRRSQAERSPSA